MTVENLIKNENFTPLVISDPSREIDGVYCGDLLSWVMGRAQEDNAFVTIMTNINVIAVASLVNVSTVILCENSTPESAVLDAARDKGVNVIKTALPTYQACVCLSELI